jgi:hypothetical protein
MKIAISRLTLVSNIHAKPIHKRHQNSSHEKSLVVGATPPESSAPPSLKKGDCRHLTQKSSSNPQRNHPLDSSPSKCNTRESILKCLQATRHKPNHPQQNPTPKLNPWYTCQPKIAPPHQKYPFDYTGESTQECPKSHAGKKKYPPTNPPKSPIRSTPQDCPKVHARNN